MTTTPTCPPRFLVLFIVLATAGATASAAHADEHRLILDGQLPSPSGSRSVQLRVLCEPAPKGAISLELWVPKAFALKDFDYEDFEGPDAEAGDKALSQISLEGGASATDITAVAAGWYSGEDPDTFVFGVSQPSRRPGKVVSLLRALDSSHNRLLWVQRGFDDPKRELRAGFGLDADAVRRLREAIAPCLPPSSPPAAKKNAR